MILLCQGHLAVCDCNSEFTLRQAPPLGILAYPQIWWIALWVKHGIICPLPDARIETLTSLSAPKSDVKRSDDLLPDPSGAAPTSPQLRTSFTRRNIVNASHHRRPTMCGRYAVFLPTEAIARLFHTMKPLVNVDRPGTSLRRRTL